MKAYLLMVALVSSASAMAWDKNTLIEFNAEGKVLYDSRIPSNRPCEDRWSAHTCKSVKVMEALVKSTPDYQEGYYLRIEQAKQEAQLAEVRAQIARQAWEDDLREREVMAAEVNARANTINAFKRPPTVNVLVSR